MIGIAEDRRQDCERSSVVEDRAEGDGRGLDRWEVCERFISDAPELPSNAGKAASRAVETAGGFFNAIK